MEEEHTRDEYIQFAKHWMKLIRVNSSIQKVDSLVEGLMNCLTKGNLPLSIVKTNKEEIEELLEEGRRAEVLGFLKLVRKASEGGRVESYIKAFEDCLKDMGLPFSDFTSEDEMNELLAKGHEAEISYHVSEAINKVKEIHESGEDVHKWIHEYIELLSKNLSSFEKNSIIIRLGMTILTD